MVTEFNHVCMFVRDIQKSVDFYTEHFGAKFMRGLYIPGSHTIGAYMQIGTGMVEFLCPLHPDENTVYGIVHMAFLTDNLALEAQQLAAKGHVFTLMPRLAGSGCGQISFVNDPNGGSVELVERADSFLGEWAPTTEVLEIDHISVHAEKLQPAINFYTEDLGLTLLHNFHMEEKGFDMVYMNLGKNIVELLHNEEPHTGPLMEHIALRVSDINSIIEKMSAKGVPVVMAPRPLATKNGLVGTVTDPDGIKVELIERVSLFDM